jgi:D-serine dehydratase
MVRLTRRITDFGAAWLGAKDSMTKKAPQSIEEFQLDDTLKGIPGGTRPFPLSKIAERKWNVLREDLPLPLMVLKQSALMYNVQVMNAFLEEHQLSIAPHAKTHMSPQLVQLQLSNGAWAITAGTVNQVQVFRQFGASRIVLANQLVGRQNVRCVVEEINGDPSFDFYCLVDSAEGIRHLGVLAEEFGLLRPIKVLLEGGYFGGRTGCRTLLEARQVITAIKEVPHLVYLAGIEGFEGSISADDPTEAEARVSKYLGFLKDLLAELRLEDLPGATEIILSAGGSGYFDMVAKSFEALDTFLPKRILLRSGCYLTHDSHMYREYQEQRMNRGWSEPQLKAALEVWSYVQSIPEEGLAILTMGKRDCPYDYFLPVPLRRYRADRGERTLSGCRITRLNDQHAYMSFPNGTDLQFGDMIASGISHPCTAFDKWRFIPIVNDQYDVVDGLLTYF